MWSRAQLVREMGASLWEVVSQRRGQPPRQIAEAADNLAALYEAVNNTDLEDLGDRIHRADPGDADLHMVGDMLVFLALGPSVTPGVISSIFYDLAHTAHLGVPTFDLNIERRSGDAVITWEGSEDRRNPAPGAAAPATARGPRILLMDSDPVLQAGTSKMLGKIFPGTPIIATDNVDAAIAYLKVHDVTLIVSEVGVLGEKTGIDLLEYVAAHHPSLVDRFLFYTDYPAASAQHSRYLAKGGVQTADLKRAIIAPAAPPTAPAPATRRATQRAPQRPATMIRTPPPQHAAPSADVLAQAIREVMPSITAEADRDGRAYGRFGDRKVFVSALYRALSPRFHGLTLDELKHTLLELNRTGVLTLARADLVAAMSPEEVATSEIRMGEHGSGAGGRWVTGPVYHFVVDEPQAVVGRDDRSLEELAGAIHAAIPGIEQERSASGKLRGRWSQERVFVAAVHRALQSEPRYRGLTLDQLKKLLLEMSRKRLLGLARVDIQALADPVELQQSGIDDRGYHVDLVIDERSP